MYTWLDSLQLSIQFLQFQSVFVRYGELLTSLFHPLHQVSTGGSLVRSVTQTLDNSSIERMARTTHLIRPVLYDACQPAPAVGQSLFLSQFYRAHKEPLVDQVDGKVTEWEHIEFIIILWWVTTAFWRHEVLSSRTECSCSSHCYFSVKQLGQRV